MMPVTIQPVPSRRSRCIKAGLVLALICSLFFTPEYIRMSGRVQSYGHDLAHFPLFAVMTVAMLVIWPRRRSALLKAVFVGLLALSLAIAIELIQPHFGRTASVLDVLLGMAGAYSVLAIYLAWRSAAFTARLSLYALAASCLLAATLPLALMVLDRHRALLDFPLIDSFERPVELGRWSANGLLLERDEHHATHGRYVLRLTVDDSGLRYPGLFLAEGEMDWRGYRYLCMDLYLEGDRSQSVWIRADDTVSGRYDERSQMLVEAKPGQNTIWLDLDLFMRTPGGRALDLSHLITMGIFLEHAKPGDVLYLDRLTLAGKSLAVAP